MLSTLINLAIGRQERHLGIPLDYLRDVARLDPALVMKLGLLGPLGNHRRCLPLEAFHIARLRAVLAEDCGACAQMAVNEAKRAGVAPTVLRAVTANRLEELSADLVAVCRFVDAALADAPEQTALREHMRERFGDVGLADLALAIALSSFFPRFKRALGHAQSCAARPVDV